MQSPKYQPQEIEPKWIQQWDTDETYKTRQLDEKREKMYTLVMFPYPSGAGLHTGHARVYTGVDVMARYFRMKGYDLLNPMGWDAFGLPAENAAIKQGINPHEYTKGNVANFKRQMKMLGLSFDWSREINTTDPDYYAVTQWLFIQFYKTGILHKKSTPVYYCEFCQTGLAQEEVMADGTHERCGNKVSTRDLPQWIFRITEYADSLLESLKDLDWPKGILEMQKNWIGRKEGLTFSHKVLDTDYTLETFTAYPAWSYADTYIVVAPEHPFVKYALEHLTDENQKNELKKAVGGMISLTPEERATGKDGVFTGFYAEDPLSGDKMPIWVANFALMDFGTGAIRCSIHDPRDREFAEKYHIPVKAVVEPTEEGGKPVEAHVDRGTLVNSAQFSGKKIEEVKEEMVQYFVDQGFAKRHVNYHLRDWIFSRQRYWGEPIPMVHCKDCEENKVSFWDEEVQKNYQEYNLETDQNNTKMDQKVSDLVDGIKDEMYGWFPLKQQDLPLTLPEVESYKPTASGKSPLSEIPEWTKVTCPVCGNQEAERETDTMPNWAGSCWYFIAFAMKNSQQPFTLENIAAQIADTKSWLPVDWYIGGAEHAVLHLLYARFWIHVLNDLGILGFREPFLRLRNVGMVIAEDHKKMSKSLGNVINPDDIAKEYGIDSLRVYEMFMAPFNQEVAWSTSSLYGSYRFLNRIWQIYQRPAKITKQGEKVDEKTAIELQRVIKKVGADIANVKFNTAIAAMMEFLNIWEDSQNSLNEEDAKSFLKLLAPFAPFVAEEIWKERFDEKNSIHLESWPQFSEDQLVLTEVEIPVQIQGKVRDTIMINIDDSEEEVVAKALQSEKINKWLEGKSDYKVIYIKAKVLNIVLS